MVLKEQLLDEISKAMDSNPDMYVGDLLEYIIDKTHPTRKAEEDYYIYNHVVKYPVSNMTLYDALVKYNKHRKNFK